ncbi:MAG: hypothetical protein HY471_00320 [Candidatus Sungbacteria bacterium]|nr:hypothetical protein [Candidatus Sungbacteria bacterium]
MKILPINLLPEEARRTVRYLVWRRIAFRFGFIAAGVLVLTVVALLPAYFFVALQRGEVGRLRDIEEQDPLRPKAEAVARDVARANDAIRTLKATLTEEEPVNQLVSAILEQVPSGIYVKHVEFQRNTRRFSFAGLASHRNDILEFEKQLEKLPFVQEVVSPLSNIIRDANIEFTIQIVIKK